MPDMFRIVKAACWLFTLSGSLRVLLVRVHALSTFPLKALNFIFFPKNFLIENLLILFFKRFYHKVGMD